MPSKSALWLRAKSLATLQARALATPLLVSHDGRHFVLALLDPDQGLDPVPLLAGRYEVVHAFIEGFARGYAEREDP